MAHHFHPDRPGDLMEPHARATRAAPRCRCLSTKLTEDEYATFTALAGTQSLSEWTRQVLFQATTRHPIENVLLAEILALRTIVLNLQFAMAHGEAPTADAMTRLIERADEEKIRRARERFAAGSTRSVR